MLKLYNTLTRVKEDFKPIIDNEVRIYSCGPTVYKDATIGNMRSYLFMDSLRRILKYNGYTLKHVMNITDVGHLVSDGDEGEDKMLKSARETGKDPMEIANYYTELFFEDMYRLNIDRPEIIAKATEHISEMIEFVEKLIEKGYGYETSTAIYFDVSKLDKYGILSNIDLDNQMSGARVDVDAEKRNPYDFALWIKAPENHLMKWNSPWGLCYPGWHIECSAMGKKYLGEEFDIHTGGVDLIPTHHENEIAQSKGLTGKIPSKFWMHSEFLLINNGRMGKSLGNAYTVQDLINEGIEPLAYKLFCFSSHYRNKLNFTWEGAKASQTALNRLREAVVKHINGTDKVDEKVIQEYKSRFMEAINDDLNMPSAMGIVWEVLKNENKSIYYRNLLCEFDEVLGLGIDKITKDYRIKNEDEIPNSINELVLKRQEVRNNKDWAESDRIRDELKKLGYVIEDTKEGPLVKQI